MKKNTKLFIILGVLVIIAFLITLIQTKGTIKRELKDFAIDDTSVVNKIFMANKENQFVTLEKIEGEWIVNQKYKAQKEKVNLLLETMQRVKISSPVANSALETIIKSLATRSVKVEIYQKDKLAKTYYVGDATPDNLGTFMLLEGSSRPFITYIPGFRGFLTQRFFLSEIEWRDRTIFNYRFNEIHSVSVEKPSKPEQSFRAINNGDNSFSLESLSDNKPVENFDTMKVKMYIGYFKKVAFDSFVTKMDPVKKDSILQSQPDYIITVEKADQTSKKLTTYIKPGINLLDGTGGTFEYDVDYQYAFMDADTSTILLIQYFVFDPIFKEKKDFFK
ncbi:MAG: DUF4340 domain-containing protein [Bacteroidota bacterium]